MPGAEYDISLICKPDLHVLLREADRAASRVVYRLGLPPCDFDDVRQDILIDLLRRVKAFDPRRGRLGAFAGTIANHGAARLTAKHFRWIQASPVDGCLEVGADGGGADRLPVPVDRTSDPSVSVQLRVDLARALETLSSPDRDLLAKLSDRTFKEVISTSRHSRATLYRRLQALRLSLTALGVLVAA